MHTLGVPLGGPHGRCSGLTPGSTHRARSWWAQGTLVDPSRHGEYPARCTLAPAPELAPAPPTAPSPHRCVFMRLATICVLVFTLGSKITSCDNASCTLCGYNQKLYPVRLRQAGPVYVGARRRF